MPVSLGNVGIVAATIATVSALACVPAIAHPHVWVKVKTEFVTEGGALTGLKHTWVFDESWLASQLEEHDTDKDGRLSAAELRPLAEESRGTLELFKSFTIVRVGGALVRAVKPRDVVIDYHGAVLGMTFTASLARPVPLKGDMLLEVYDATYFSSFTFEGEDAVAFAGAAPEGCSVKVGVAPSPQQMRDYRQMLREIGTELAKPFTPKSTAISCTAGGSAIAVGSTGGAKSAAGFVGASTSSGARSGGQQSDAPASRAVNVK